MGEVVVLADRPLSPRGALERIRELWEAGSVYFTGHAEERMRQRGITALDVEHLVKRTGRVVEYSKPGRFWRYTLEGKTVEQKFLRCIIELKGKMVIVTVLWPSGRK